PVSAVSWALLAINGVRIEGAFLYHIHRAIIAKAAEKAASVAFVTDARTCRLDAHQYGIGVAVHAHLAHAQGMAAPFSLTPQLAARAAVKRHGAARARLLIRLLVHETEHQHLARSRILNNRGNKPVELGKVEIHPAS